MPKCLVVRLADATSTNSNPFEIGLDDCRGDEANDLLTGLRCSRLAALFFLRRETGDGAKPQPRQQWHEWYGGGRQSSKKQGARSFGDRPRDLELPSEV